MYLELNEVAEKKLKKSEAQRINLGHDFERQRFIDVAGFSLIESNIYDEELRRIMREMKASGIIRETKLGYWEFVLGR